MRLSSRLVLDTSSSLLRPATLHLEADGKIKELIWDVVDEPPLPGILCPGFVNAHCHLELSHLRGKIKEHTGMAGFIADLLPNRDSVPEAQRREAMTMADEEMYRNGIVAVGDISNGNESREVKAGSGIYYHTFIELLDLDPGRTEAVMAKGRELMEKFKSLPATLVPHAPYTCTPELLKRLKEWNNQNPGPVCIHLGESMAESEFFQHRGPIYDLFKKMNLDLSWVPLHNNSLEYILEYYNARSLQTVHNTYLSAEQYLCTCPNANLYIENRLPVYQSWIKKNLKVTIGTDSLASNHALGIHHEIQAIRKAFPEISLALLLTWATKNGADFLGISGMYGSLEVGKMPGILQLSGLNPGDDISVKRLA